MRSLACQRPASLLPWYVTDRLTAEERERVRTHLLTCAACQRELDEWRAIASAAVSQRLAPSAQVEERAWRGIQTRIAAVHPDVADQPASASGSRLIRFRRSGGDGRPDGPDHGPRRAHHLVSRVPLVVTAAAITALLVVVGLVGITGHLTDRLGWWAANTPTASAPASGTPPPALFTYDFFRGVTAVDPTHGARLWNYQQAPFANQAFIIGSRAVLVSQASGGKGQVVALDVTTGHQVWAASLTSAFATLATTNDTVFAVTKAGSPDELVALNATTGAVRWRVTPTIIGNTISAYGSTVIVGDSVSSLIAYSASDGKVLWKINGFVSGSVIERDGLFVTMSCQGQFASYCAMRLDPSSGKALWSAPLHGMPEFMKPVVTGPGAVYILTEGETGTQPGQAITALNASDGGVRWTYLIPASVAGSGSVLSQSVTLGASATSVYMVAKAGEVAAINAATATPLWTARMPYSLTTPTYIEAIPNGATVYITSGSDATALSGGSGKLLWSIGTGSGA